VPTVFAVSPTSVAWAYRRAHAPLRTWERSWVSVGGRLFFIRRHIATLTTAIPSYNDQYRHTGFISILEGDECPAEHQTVGADTKGENQCDGESITRRMVNSSQCGFELAEHIPLPISAVAAILHPGYL
jgi:hypothetical protein